MPKIVNSIIKFMIASDFVLNLGWGLLGPVFAIFIVQNITIGSPSEAAKVAGFASLSYWAVKSVLQIPIGRYLDKNRGEKDDFWFMVIGTFIAGFIPLGYLLSSAPWHIYLLQMVYAVGMSMAFPAWLAIFTRHIDKGKEALEWGVESTFLGAGAGIAGGIGGIVASTFGFGIVFVFVSAFTFLATALLLFIKNDISPRNIGIKVMPPVRPVIEP
ncbi:MAG: MFS transporter [Candidatus Staskawiczbacteria bacterium]|nr:MFS transporter [Candidatus Staskawiczbacteria bacterium]